MLPNLSLLGNHIQVFEPISFNETDAIWYGTKIEDVDGSLGKEAFSPTSMRCACARRRASRISARSTILTNFEQIQRGLAAAEDEWIYSEPRLRQALDRIHTLEDGTIKDPRPTSCSCANTSASGSASSEGGARYRDRAGGLR